MTQENNKVVKSDESHKSQARIDQSRRSFARAGVIAPVIMTLTSKTALGAYYQCTVSGVMSGNVSSHDSDLSVCSSGYTKDQWLAVDTVDTSTPPNIDDWIAARINPFRVLRKTTGVAGGLQSIRYRYKKNVTDTTCVATPMTDIQRQMCAAIFSSFPVGGTLNSAECDLAATSGTNPLEYINATTFFDVFGNGSTSAIWGILNTGVTGDLEFDASLCYLNASAGQIEGVDAADVMILYNQAFAGNSSAAELLQYLHF